MAGTHHAKGTAPVRDRLLMTLFIAALVHGLIIVGLTFAGASGKTARPGWMCCWSPMSCPRRPATTTAAYLAQRTQLGSGNTRDRSRPQRTLPACRCSRTQGRTDGNTLADSGAGRRQRR